MLYQLLIRLLAPVVWVALLIETRRKKAGKQFFWQRLGFQYPILPKTDKRVWIHCASVGEVRAAEPLIRALMKKHDLLVTTNTNTGKAHLENQFGEQVSHCYLPLDWPYAIKRFIKRCKPTDCWIIETEIWPNLYRVCHQKQIPVSILNARLSQKTLNAPQWLKETYRQTLTHVHLILARSEKEAKRFISLGADENQVHIVDNLKFAQQEQVPHANNPMPRDYILVASTHAHEELQIAQQWLNLRRPELLVIVPRHPKRSQAIQKQLTELHSRFSVASQEQPITPDTQIYLEDSLGKLMPLFEHAQLVIMGGSFAPRGGHNVLEPALYKRCILTGKDMSDFETEASLLLQQNGLIQCNNYTELMQNVLHLLNHPSVAQTMGESALAALQSKQNTLEQYLELLLPSQTDSKKSNA